MAERSSDSHADTRLYLIVHNAFRLMTTRFVDATEQLDPAALQPMIRSRWNDYAALLHEHHHNEDDSIFPALVAGRPDLIALITRLEDDHQHLIGTMEDVDSAISAFDATPDAAHQQTLHNALLAVRELFFPHLDTEDEQTSPRSRNPSHPKSGSASTTRRSSRSRGSTCRPRWAPSTKSSTTHPRTSNRHPRHCRSGSCWRCRGARNTRPG